MTATGLKPLSFRWILMGCIGALVLFQSVDVFLTYRATSLFRARSSDMPSGLCNLKTGKATPRDAKGAKHHRAREGPDNGFASAQKELP
ncbi:hypothetical protein H257_02098 [Aphanomyces astaci]|uniref:Uncharacterized protein n=1 Tax=Aphanomyces astaci TaxID=112090 RepID=W4H539_APHAT|nr:hypothetical protein H257_02098 [Aphanomyces astaci]ETV87100.1 hypothetical protein H257_02098 [Aphanomyces astaci]|eukprot:XP_009823899.1 hypothetical protein H257_02098 [Aphanomyces astaci]